MSEAESAVLEAADVSYEQTDGNSSTNRRLAISNNWCCGVSSYYREYNRERERPISIFTGRCYYADEVETYTQGIFYRE